jgi:hypothetical protein
MRPVRARPSMQPFLVMPCVLSVLGRACNLLTVPCARLDGAPLVAPTPTPPPCHTHRPIVAHKPSMPLTMCRPDKSKSKFWSQNLLIYR